MTQLIIDGTEAVLPQNFSVTVKRENSFFTKSGEYTYDCTLRLDNAVNQQLYGFLGRTNKADQIVTGRTAVLTAGGHVYCRGTELVTRWTDNSVSIQILSGESEMNYFIGQDRKMEDLDMGSIDPETFLSVFVTSPTLHYPSVDYCIPPVRLPGGFITNRYRPEAGAAWRLLEWFMPQPYLMALLRRAVTALGYTLEENQLESTSMKYLFIVNTVATLDYARMVPGWTVREFFEEVEKLTGCVFVTDNMSKTCRIMLRKRYYEGAQKLTLRNVTDAYEAELADDESRQADFTTSSVSYDLPSGYYANLQCLPDGMTSSSDVVDCASLSEAVELLSRAKPKQKTIARDTSTGRLYIRIVRTEHAGTEQARDDVMAYEVDQFRSIDRHTESTLELGITPAPMTYLYDQFPAMEVIDLATGETARKYGMDTRDPEGSNPSSGETEAETFEDYVSDYAGKEESAKGDLLAAFYCGDLGYRTYNGQRSDEHQWAYTDAQHARIIGSLYNFTPPYSPAAVGSLRLQDVEEELYGDDYGIDTAHPTTFETYDPNVADPRQIYIINNRPYVVRDIEETITSEGRRQKWKLTCYPMQVAEGTISGWVLDTGRWNDTAAWLDDGRWNDAPAG